MTLSAVAAQAAPEVQTAATAPTITVGSCTLRYDLRMFDDGSFELHGLSDSTGTVSISRVSWSVDGSTPVRGRIVDGVLLTDGAPAVFPAGTDVSTVQFSTPSGPEPTPTTPPTTPPTEPTTPPSPSPTPTTPAPTEPSEPRPTSPGGSTPPSTPAPQRPGDSGGISPQTPDGSSDDDRAEVPQVPDQAGEDWVPMPDAARSAPPGEDYSDPVPQAPGSGQDTDAISGSAPSAQPRTQSEDSDASESDTQADSAGEAADGFAFSWPLAGLIAVGLGCLAFIGVMIGRRPRS